MIATKANLSVSLVCDHEGCTRVYQPNPRVFDLTRNEGDRCALARELRARADRQGWGAFAVFPGPDSKEQAGWRDRCPVHRTKVPVAA